ncbi:MAG: hypothetical protein LAQ69_05345 [Acidobacteriia bacterium]|nr:hypothetical protein [Terriglobia bacterium]
MVKFRYLFHGTSSIHRASIQESGLLPRNGAIHLTTHPKVALIEAKRTVKGEGYLPNGYKGGTGGLPLIVAVERSAAVNLRLDALGYYEQLDRTGYRPSELRYAFTTSEHISPASISFIEADFLAECEKLLNEIEKMIPQHTFGFTIMVDLVNDRVYRS